MIRWISNCSIFIKIDVKIYNSCLHIVDKYSDCWCIDLWQRHNLGSFETLEGGRPELCLLVVVRTRSFFSETGPKIKSVHQNSSSVHCFVFVVGLFFTRTELRPWSCSGCSFITRRRPLKTVRETLQRQRFQCRCCRTIRTWLNNISDAHLNSCSSGVVESCRRCSYSNQQLIRNGLIGISFKRDGAMPNRQREHPCSSRSTRSYDLLGTTLRHSRCQLLNYIIRRRLWQTLLYGSCQAYR